MNSKAFSYSLFVIRIIAIISMVFDHIGIAISMFPGYNESLVLAFRYIGRLALPLFCFMIVEGVIHTRNYSRYAGRLAILAVIITIAQAIFYFNPQFGFEQAVAAGNIFLDLLLGSFLIYALMHKNPYFKLLAIIPIAISILSFIAKTQEFSSHSTVRWYPAFLRMQYDWLSLLFMVGFLGAYFFAKIFYKATEETRGLSYEDMKGTDEWRRCVNLFSLFITIVIGVIYYLIYYINPSIVFWNNSMQLFAIVAGLLIIFYNGKRGYDKKWFRIFNYSFYPLHILIIFLTVYLISISTGIPLGTI